jgi:hypothetical protein
MDFCRGNAKRKDEPGQQGIDQCQKDRNGFHDSTSFRVSSKDKKEVLSESTKRLSIPSKACRMSYSVKIPG